MSIPNPKPVELNHPRYLAASPRHSITVGITLGSGLSFQGNLFMDHEGDFLLIPDAHVMRMPARTIKGRGNSTAFIGHFMPGVSRDWDYFDANHSRECSPRPPASLGVNVSSGISGAKVLFFSRSTEAGAGPLWWRPDGAPVASGLRSAGGFEVTNVKLMGAAVLPRRRDRSFQSIEFSSGDASPPLVPAQQLQLPRKDRRQPSRWSFQSLFAQSLLGKR